MSLSGWQRPGTSAAGAETAGAVKPQSPLAGLYHGPVHHPGTRRRPSVAVVGAGLAGLNAAWFLQRAGCAVTVYEASARVGGRIQTDVGGLERGVVSELGGEFIDSSNLDMLALTAHFDLPLLDMLGGTEETMAAAYFVDGRHYTEADVRREFAHVASQLAADASKLPTGVSYQRYNAHALALDRLSIAEYLDRLGLVGWLHRLIDVAYLTEYGMETDEQSCLNLLTLIGTDMEADFAVFGASDQRYKLVGGNEQIIHALARELVSPVCLEHRLVRLRRDVHGVRLTFDTPGATHDCRVDAVVLALPFTLLRQVDLDDALPPGKRRVIDELGYGCNAKLLMGTRCRSWREQGFGGDLYSDLSFQTGWDGSRRRNGERGVYTFFLGGNAGLALGQGTPEAHADRFSAQLDQVFPGVAAQRTGSVARAHWPSEPYALGSYSCYRTGQWTSLAGMEGRHVGPVYFAGEHCSREFQGFMNGAAQTGRLAATALLAAVF
jgi:monoamine oxidase